MIASGSEDLLIDIVSNILRNCAHELSSADVTLSVATPGKMKNTAVGNEPVTFGLHTVNFKELNL